MGWCSLGLWLLMAGACAPDTKLQTAVVKGTVTLDGKPLQEGVIVFTKEGEIPRELPIVQGRFEGTVYVGTNHVQFAAYRVARQRPNLGPGSENVSRENILPDKYNQKSTMAREVKPGENQFDFALN